MDRETGLETPPALRESARGHSGADLRELRRQLNAQFQKQEWEALSRTLEAVARMGHSAGQMELCLRAQTLRELMGNRAGGRQDAGKRLVDIFNNLIAHLSHLQWINQTNH